MGYTNSPLVVFTRISPNKTVNRTHSIDTVSIHCMAGNLSVESLGSWFSKESTRASSNYGIGSDGRIGMYVEEKDRSWCTSSKPNDHRAITIEVANDGPGPEWHVTDAALNSLIKLLADICRRNNIKELKWKADKSLIGQVDKQNMTVHMWFKNKSCPGNYLYNKHSYIANEVNKLLGVASVASSASAGISVTQGVTQVKTKETATSTVNYNKNLPTGITLKKGSKGENVGILQTALNKLISAGLKVDCDFGGNTYNAVKAFQKKYSSASGMPDGIVGAKTIYAIDTLLNGGTLNVAAQPQAQKTQQSTSFSFNQHVHDLQWALNKDGITDSNGQRLVEDGIWGAKTASAVAKVLLSVKTIRRYTNTTSWVQCRVGASVDGLFGQNTATCVRNWQKAHGLASDGVVGKNTMIALVRMYVPNASY